MLQGVFPPVPTPFEKGRFSPSRLKENISRWAQTGLAGFIVSGSNGESPYLSYEEKVQAVAAAKEAAPKLHVIAGTGLETTEGTIQLTKACADAGADAALILPPHYFKGSMTDGVLIDFYQAVADESPIPVLLYNMPKNTGINLSADLIVQLSRHERIVGLKDSGGDIVQISQVVAKTAPDFAVFAGSGSFLMPALAMGAKGGMMAVANVAPKECVRLMEYMEKGLLAEARRLQQALIPLNALVTNRFGVPGLKAALDELGYFGGSPRPPLISLGDEDRRVIAQVIDAFRDQVEVNDYSA